MKLLRSTLINIALAAIIFFLVSAFQERNLLKTDSSPAPYFNLPLLSATDTRLSIAELKGKTTVIYFFAPWCTVCKYSMPNLEAALLDSDINAVGIALDYKNQHEVMQFVDELKLTMPILLGDQQTQSNYKISAFPTYYVINEQLQITARSMGYSSELGISLRADN
ncbi:TlpA disulfide reductase family protein [Pseudoalteromonas haloplanktis]|uniref:TlpA disulfide reductase family protein n=1 Tax=Pseudoalteromonas haloplanktis TaxID=228 RepID=A0ABU1BCL1_PSEHA|nr:TlpA disulfide reductase family protein [Pseudoalteromonas haloplanktis]MDQ9091347.1 TlpA disulfide reductase family protein [Pseudoalteromonas haloplanktis]